MKKRIKLPFLTSLAVLFSTVIGMSFNNSKTGKNAFAADATAICQGIANDENNNIAETKAQGNPVPIYRTLLKYDVALGDSANETNVASTVGQGIKLNGVALSDIPNTRIDYANGSKYIRIKIPQSYQDALTGTICLEVVNGTLFENKILDGSKFSLISGKWSKVSDVAFSDIVWNDTGYNNYKDYKGVLLAFSANLSKRQTEIDGGIQSTNFASSVGEHIYLGGFKLSSLDDALVSYHSQNMIYIYAKDMQTYRTLEIEEGTIFLDSSLPQVTLYYDISNSWSTTPKTYNDVAFSDIVWNEKGYNFYKDYKGVLLAFSANLSKRQVEIDANVEYINFASTVGEHILLGGKKLSTLPGALLSYHSQNMLYISVDSMSSYRTLKIEAGTQFIDSALPELTLYYTTTDAWSTEKEPATITSFSTILWNNTGYDNHTGKNGLLLSYKDNLSNASNEINGELKDVNYVGSDIGAKIKLDGTPLKDITNAEIMYYGSTLLWVYAPNMKNAKELVVESVEFLTVILPETHFMLYGEEWAEVFTIKSIINGEEKISTSRKSQSVVLGEDYYGDLVSDEGLSLKLVSFEVGGTTYKQGQTLTVNSDVTVNVNAVGFETTTGASVRMSETSGIRFETKISKTDYDRLISTYGISNVEIGTYIIKKDNLGFTAFDDYFNNQRDDNSANYLKVVANKFVNESSSSIDGYYKYFGTLDGIIATDYSTEYCGIGYIKINDGNNQFTLYGLNKNDMFSRSVYDVIRSAYLDYPYRSEENTAINSVLDGIVPIVSCDSGLKIDTSIQGYRSPYSLEYDSQNNEYVITGESEIKTVLINGEKRNENGGVINVLGAPYKLSNYNLVSSSSFSTLRFSLTSITAASELVDFTLEFPSDRDLKILQLTDTQIIDSSQMRTSDRLGSGGVEAYSRGKVDKNCFNQISYLIEKEQPDLIVFTGDIVYGEFDDSGEILTMIVEFMDSFDIPWAPVFGNHDNESYKGVNWQCEQFVNAKNCLFKQGNLTGNGNYTIGLTDSYGQIKRVIYMMDTNGCLKGAGLGNDQIAWMKSVSSSIDKAYGTKVPAFICYHIPSLDFSNAAYRKYGYDSTTNFNIDDSGTDGDYGQKNEKMSTFNPLLATDYKSANVDGVFAGHDHVNNFSILYDGIRYTYGTKTGTYDYYNNSIIGGTIINVSMSGEFKVAPSYLDKTVTDNKAVSTTTMTVFSDLHHDIRDYGGFHCTKSNAKLRKIVNETQGSKFYINLGDAVNSCEGSLKNYYDVMSWMKELNLDTYNNENKGYSAGNRMIYNLLGNHEVAYAEKSSYQGYVPYVEGIGSTAVFKRNNLMFVAVDALFNRENGSDSPADILTCTQYTIPTREINYLKKEVQSKMDNNVEGIVWISHVAMQDIDNTSKNSLINELKSYGLPMTVFEGHTHIENYQTLSDSVLGTYCEIYTLPAVTLNDTYPYYNVTFRNGKVWCVDKHLNGVV